MLKVQEYLRSGKTINDLHAELGIECTFHSTLPLVLLNYSQLNSPKTNAIVKECRGLMLDIENNFKVISRGFNRFFHYGEYEEETNQFDWSNFVCYEKRDGSYIGVVAYNGELIAHTRGSFGQLECNGCGKTWSELVLECLTHEQKKYIREFRECYTFVFELETPFNWVVVTHYDCKVVLLTIHDNYDLTEIPQDVVDEVAECRDFNRPPKYEFEGLQEILFALDEMAMKKDEREGFVVIDSNGLRLKMKSTYYCHLHRLKNNGNIASWKNLLPIVLSNEIGEVLAIFPLLEDRMRKCEKLVNRAFDGVFETWWVARDIKERKKLARFVLEHQKEFSSIIFKMVDKFGSEGTENDLREIFAASEDLIYKVLFKGRKDDTDEDIVPRH